MSDALRLQVAATTRVLVMEGVLGYSGHISARLPPGDGADPNAFVIQSMAAPRVGVEPGGLLTMGGAGGVRDGVGAPPLEVHIHGEIYKARPDVHAVAHFHHDDSNLLTVVADLAFVPMKNHACRWSDGVPVHADSSHIDTPEKGREVVATLGGRAATLLRGHGQVLVAEDVPCLLADTVHFVENVAVLLKALGLGRPLPLTDTELGEFAAGFDRARHARKLWDYYVTSATRAEALPESWVDGLLFGSEGSGGRLSN